MSERPAWVPAGINVEIPNAARVDDYILGGRHNLPIDRAIGDEVLRALPTSGQIAGSNRAFLRRAVRYMADQGITQFLDLGSGLPTVGNVHEVAQASDPSSRVVYVDHDEVAVAHGEFLLAGNDGAAAMVADLCTPQRVLGAPAVKQLLDLDQPLGVLMVAVLHVVPDELDPAGIVARYRDAVAPGSLIALSHLTADHQPAEPGAVTGAPRPGRDPVFFRPHHRIAAMFDGLELVDPGIVAAPHWRPDAALLNGGPRHVYAGVGRKP
jgi:hypothetical protein